MLPSLRLENTKSAILPELVELTNDEESNVRVTGLDTVVNILPMLDDGKLVDHAVVWVEGVTKALCVSDWDLSVSTPITHPGYLLQLTPCASKYDLDNFSSLLPVLVNMTWITSPAYSLW